MKPDSLHPLPASGPHPRPDFVLRTRRSVMEAAREIQMRRKRQRRQIGIALLALGGLVVLVTPALWSEVNDLSSGDHFFDMPFMVVVLAFALVSAVLAVLLVTWRGGNRDAHDGWR